MALVGHGNNRCTRDARDAHPSSTVIDTGDTVARGQQIGASGATGNATGAHPHRNVVDCDSRLSHVIPNTSETGASYPTGSAPVSRND
ncbi:M23 family metallopeptidase [Streptomyces sp. NPDC059802]|uniref:M23 family metallopeptidase n=1 Tax=Streptomyces sp. NPDC059802 TaxID=3346952 RepID=UPI0036696300